MKMTRQSLALLCATAALACVTTPSLAYKAGDVVVRAGLASVMPTSDNDGTIEADDALGLGLSLSYMATSSIAVELLGASPFNHDILDGNGNKIAEAQHLPPTLLVNYYFPEAVSGSLLSYAGIGVNHTFFFEEKISGGGATLELDSSTGLALQAGADWNLNEHWGLNAAVWYIDIDTEATITPTGGAGSTMDVEIDPWVLMLGAAYRF